MTPVEVKLEITLTYRDRPLQVKCEDLLTPGSTKGVSPEHVGTYLQRLVYERFMELVAAGEQKELDT